MEQLPYEVKLSILKEINDIDVLKSICASSKEYRAVCKKNWSSLFANVDPRFSVVELENYDTYGYEEFQSENKAIERFKEGIKGYERIFEENRYDVEYDINIDVLAGMMKVTYNDYSDKIKSYIICGLSRSQNKKLKRELFGK